MESRVVKQEIDLSSCLPEDVFSNIISRIPLKEAVRTSVLVKRWKNAWKYVTRLELYPTSILKPNVETVRRDSQNSNDITSTMTDTHRGTRLFTSIIQSIQNEVTHCQIFHFHVNIMNGDLKEWVEELVKKISLKSLSLKCSKPRCVTDNAVLVLPPTIFCALECLDLTGYKLLDASPFQSCEKLRILKLSAILLGDGSVAEIFSFCKWLEKLSLICCEVSNLEICSRSLKFLELQGSSIDAINVSAESLTTLILNRTSCERSRFVINAPGVTELQTYSSEGNLTTEGLLELCTGIQSSHEGSYPLYSFGLFQSFHEGSYPLYSSRMGCVSPFKNLQVLCTALDLNNVKHATLLSYILKVCFQLEELDVTVEAQPRYPQFARYPRSAARRLSTKKQEIFDSIPNSLGVVSIQNFSAKALEIRFVEHLITKAPKMREIIVTCADNCSTEEVAATLSLLSLPRACEDVSVVIEPPKRRSNISSVIEWKKQMQELALMQADRLFAD